MRDVPGFWAWLRSEPRRQGQRFFRWWLRDGAAPLLMLSMVAVQPPFWAISTGSWLAGIVSAGICFGVIWWAVAEVDLGDEEPANDGPACKCGQGGADQTN